MNPILSLEDSTGRLPAISTRDYDAARPAARTTNEFDSFAGDARDNASAPADFKKAGPTELGELLDAVMALFVAEIAVDGYVHEFRSPCD
jgi:hypothetical protein